MKQETLRSKPVPPYLLEALRLSGLNVNMPSRVVATVRRKTAWGPWSKTKEASALRLLGMNQEQQRAHVHSLVNTFKGAVAHAYGYRLANAARHL